MDTANGNIKISAVSFKIRPWHAFHGDTDVTGGDTQGSELL
jgi:hypothetical protein